MECNFLAASCQCTVPVTRTRTTSKLLHFASGWTMTISFAAVGPKWWCRQPHILKTPSHASSNDTGGIHARRTPSWQRRRFSPVMRSNAVQNEWRLNHALQGCHGRWTRSLQIPVGPEHRDCVLHPPSHCQVRGVEFPVWQARSRPGYANTANTITQHAAP
eukprot:879352-Rhodomonas_salina.1